MKTLLIVLRKNRLKCIIIKENCTNYAAFQTMYIVRQTSNFAEVNALQKA